MKKNNNNLFSELFKHESLYAPVLLCLGAFLVRFGFLALSDNLRGPQPMLNIITSLHIFNDPGFMSNIFYLQLPAFLYSLSAAIKIGGEQLLSGRLLSVFWGSLSVVPFYYLLKEIFDKRIAVFSSLIICFHPGHIIKSSITMPDVMGLVFILSALYCLQKKKVNLSATFVCLGTACTYVSWLFVVIIPVFIIVDQTRSIKQRMKDATAFLIIACAFLLFWILITNNLYKEHNIFYKNFFETGSFSEYIFISMQTVSMITRELFLYPAPFLFLLSLAGIYQSVRIRKYYYFSFLIGALILTLSLGLFRHEINLIEQGELIISILLIPYIVLGLDYILSVFGRRKSRYAAISVILVCFNLLFLSLEARSFLPKEVKQLSFWLKENIHDSKTKVYINSDSDQFFSSIMMLSGLPQGNFHYYGKEEIDFSDLAWNERDFLIHPGEEDEAIVNNLLKKSIFIP